MWNIVLCTCTFGVTPCENSSNCWQADVSHFAVFIGKFCALLRKLNNKPCLLFAMQLDGLEAWRARFGRNATRALLQHAYDRINGALRNDDVIIHTSDHQFYALVVVNDLCDLAATLDIGNRLQKAIDPGFQIDGRSHYFSPVSYTHLTLPTTPYV